LSYTFYFFGKTPVKLSSSNAEIDIKVKMLKAKYTCGDTEIYTKQAIAAMKGDEDEESFMRTFHLVLLATIVCPATSDTVDWRFLYSLTDLDTMKSIDWSSFCLEYIMTEVERFQDKLSKMPDDAVCKAFHVGGCLPFLAVSSFILFFLQLFMCVAFYAGCVFAYSYSFLQVAYMDHLDINYGAHDYGVPRLRHICSSDFQIVTKLDRINSSGRHMFGALDVSFSFLLDNYF
jgi:hypothetical protein